MAILLGHKYFMTMKTICPLLPTIRRAIPAEDDSPLSHLTNNDHDRKNDTPLASLLVLEAVDRSHAPQDKDLAVLMSAPTWTDIPFQFQAPGSTFKGNLEAEDGSLKRPYQFFQDKITDEMLDWIVQETNDYLHQKIGTLLKTTRKEIYTFIALNLSMGLALAQKCLELLGSWRVICPCRSSHVKG